MSRKASQTDQNAKETSAPQSSKNRAQNGEKRTFVERRKSEKGRNFTLLIMLTLTAVICLKLGSMRAKANREAHHSVNFIKEVELPCPVDVVMPVSGGVPRLIVQTGTIEAIETAELRPRVSGYVKSISLEIGEMIDEGQLAAELDAPEILKDVNIRTALCELAKCRISQAKAKLKSAIAEREAANGEINQMKSEVLRREAELLLRNQELKRFEMLVKEKAIETKLVEEKAFEAKSAFARLENARAARVVASGKLLTIETQIERAESDIKAAEAEHSVSKVELERAKVMASFLSMTSPFAGVVTARNFDRGDFVQAATGGNQMPILTIARTDRVRAVIHVPGADVPFVRAGLDAAIKVHSLGGREFVGTVSRVAGNSDLRTRTMRVEVDLPNPDGVLAGGMYGAISIEVPAPTDELSIPKKCLVGRALNGFGTVYVIKDNKLQARRVGVGRAYGDRIEILEGLTSDEWIVDGKTSDFRSLRKGRHVKIRDKIAAVPKENENQSAESQLAIAE